MASIKAFIRTTVKRDSVNVRFRLLDGRDFQVFHKSEISVNPNDWDNENECIKIRRVVKDKDIINKSIRDRKEYIEAIYKREGKRLTSEMLEVEIDKLIHPENYTNESEKYNTVFSFIVNFIDKAPERRDKKTGRQLTYNNIQQYKATQKHLHQFAEIEGKSDYQFEEINKDFYIRFVTYLQNEILERNSRGKLVLDKNGNPQIIKEKFTQNSVGKHIRILKLMLNEADSDVNMRDFYVFTEEVDNVYLNETELSQLKEVNLPETSHLDRVRDWFLLLAWTGSRFSDLEKITKANIKDGFLIFRQQKTNTKVQIPLHPVVEEIFDKYNYKMPEHISNQRFNEYIKEVCKIAKIDCNETFTRTEGGRLVNKTYPKYELVSSHTGRRSFCTNMYKRGLPTIMIMSISGHKTEKSFLKYIKVRQEEHAEMMQKKFNEFYK